VRGGGIESQYILRAETEKEVEFSPYYFQWEIFGMAAQSEVGISSK
jgi:hypothetical protein